MCGVFGLAWGGRFADGQAAVRTVDCLARLSQTRGREASGVAFKSGLRELVVKAAVPAARLLRTSEYRRLRRELKHTALTASGTLIGHTRLVTNGGVGEENNHPVVTETLLASHNGIIVNDIAIWARYPELIREFTVDTEVLVRLVALHQGRGESLSQAVIAAYEEISGEATAAILCRVSGELALATNTGSLYFSRCGVESLVFASEEYILRRALAESGLKAGTLERLQPGQGMIVSEGAVINRFTLQPSARYLNGGALPRRPRTVEANARSEPPAVRRCTACILPVSFPFLTFDGDGVCRYCAEYLRRPLASLSDLEARLTSARAQGANGDFDCIVALSGGRDSCYGLHILKEVLGARPLAFTYDWGMVTDLARRNMARVCGALGVEHVVVSADIAFKRTNILNNVSAWLKRPHLGTIPLLMAGDKQFYYHANKLMQRARIPLAIFCENLRLEKTRFKTAFAGIDERERRLFSLSAAEKVRLLAFYAGQVLKNPRYLNRSLVDSLAGYCSAYLLRHDYEFLFDYVPWDEESIISTLCKQYGWELAPDTECTWRIGDGSAPFYNYVYHQVAGFSEHDTFRSNQVREGMISRDDALLLAARDNQPRWEGLRWYAQTVGFDLDSALTAIGRMERLY